MTAFLYAVRSGAFVKIGRAANLTARLSGLQVGFPLPLTLVHWVEVPESYVVKAERRAQRRYRAKHARGEWFSISDKQAIDALNRAAAWVAAEEADIAEILARHADAEPAPAPRKARELPERVQRWHERRRHKLIAAGVIEP